MKILILSHEYPPVGGGGGQSCKTLINELVQRGEQVTLITAQYKDLPNKEEFSNFRIIRVPSLRKNPYKIGLLGMGTFIIFSFFAGLRVIRKWKPQLIHAQFAVPAGFTAFLLNKCTTIPYMLTSHLGDVPGGVPEKTDGWFRWFFPGTIPIWKHAAKVVCVSNFTAALAYDNYGIVTTTIPNGVDLSTGVKQISTNNPPTIVFAGRFVAQKNLPAILEILESVRDFNWKCILIGDGPLFKETREKIISLGLKERFSLTGWISPKKVDEYLSCGDILLMPSLSEGLPVVGLQALTKGLVILANKVGGFTDLVIENRNGVLANIGDKSTLIEALKEYLCSPEKLKSGRMASLEIARNYDIKKIADQYLNIYTQILL